MKHNDPKHTSDDAFEDRPTGTWRAVRVAQAPALERDLEEAETAPEQIIELAN